MTQNTPHEANFAAALQATVKIATVFMVCKVDKKTGILQRCIASFKSSKWRDHITAEALAKLWKIGLEMARRTVEATTQ
jgi:hypothetical protein